MSHSLVKLHGADRLDTVSVWNVVAHGGRLVSERGSLGSADVCIWHLVYAQGQQEGSWRHVRESDEDEWCGVEGTSASYGGHQTPYCTKYLSMQVVGSAGCACRAVALSQGPGGALNKPSHAWAMENGEMAPVLPLSNTVVNR